MQSVERGYTICLDKMEDQHKSEIKRLEKEFDRRDQVGLIMLISGEATILAFKKYFICSKFNLLFCGISKLGY